MLRSRPLAVRFGSAPERTRTRRYAAQLPANPGMMSRIMAALPTVLAAVATVAGSSAVLAQDARILDRSGFDAAVLLPACATR